ncbi:MAG: hypothetical protein WC188_12920 [Candidatus Caldatribacteriota bacterium]
MSDTFAIKEVLDFNVFEYSSTGYGDLLFTVDYAKSSSINTTGERLPIRGGQGNYKIMDLDHTKDCTFNSILPLVDVNALATKLGKAVATGATSATKKEILTTSATNTITLTQTPLTGTLKIYKLAYERDLGAEQTAGTPGTTENKYSIDGKVVTLNATTAPAGSQFICTYEYTSGANAKNIKITASDFPGFITITGRGLVDDDQEGKKVPVSFKVHKAKVQVGFELTMASDAATELDFTTDCYTIINSDGEREYIDIVKLEDEAY